MFRTTCFALAACFAGSVPAQNPAHPGPADPKAAASLRSYVSAFEGYRPYVDSEISQWRKVNDEVGRLKGHTGHVPPRSGGAAKPGAKPPAQSGDGVRK